MSLKSRYMHFGSLSLSLSFSSLSFSSFICLSFSFLFFLSFFLSPNHFWYFLPFYLFSLLSSSYISFFLCITFNPFCCLPILLSICLSLSLKYLSDHFVYLYLYLSISFDIFFSLSLSFLLFIYLFLLLCFSFFLPLLRTKILNQIIEIMFPPRFCCTPIASSCRSTIHLFLKI